MKGRPKSSGKAPDSSHPGCPRPAAGQCRARGHSSVNVSTKDTALFFPGHRQRDGPVMPAPRLGSPRPSLEWGAQRREKRLPWHPPSASPTLSQSPLRTLFRVAQLPPRPVVGRTLFTARPWLRRLCCPFSLQSCGRAAAQGQRCRRGAGGQGLLRAGLPLLPPTSAPAQQVPQFSAAQRHLGARGRLGCRSSPTRLCPRNHEAELTCLF